MTLRDAFVLALLIGGQFAVIVWIAKSTHKNLTRKYPQHTDEDVDKFLHENSKLMDDLSK